jgi:hypothetical protein
MNSPRRLRSLLPIGVSVMSMAALAALGACSSDSTTGGGTTNPGSDSGTSYQTDGSTASSPDSGQSSSNDAGGNNDTDAGNNTPTDSGNGTDSSTGAAAAGASCPGPAASQGGCTTGLLCEDFAGKGGNFCTKACSDPGNNASADCGGGAPFTGKCTPNSYCQIQ